MGEVTAKFDVTHRSELAADGKNIGYPSQAVVDPAKRSGEFGGMQEFPMHIGRYQRNFGFRVQFLGIILPGDVRCWRVATKSGRGKCIDVVAAGLLPVLKAARKFNRASPDIERRAIDVNLPITLR